MIFQILEKISCYFLVTLSEKKELEKIEVKKMYILTVKKLERRFKDRKVYKGPYKELIEYLLTEKPLDDLLNLLSIEDCVDLELGSTIEFNLNNFFINRLRISIKNNFKYKLEIPLFRREEDGLVLIKFIHSGYPDINVEEDCDLNITRFLASEVFEENVKEIIVYDFLSLERYSIYVKKNNYFSDVFKIIKSIDSNLIPRFAHKDNCSKCNNKKTCKKSTDINNEGDDIINAFKTREKEIKH